MNPKKHKEKWDADKDRNSKSGDRGPRGRHRKRDSKDGRPVHPSNLPKGQRVNDLRVDGDIDLSIFDDLEPDQDFMIMPSSPTVGQVYTVEADPVSGEQVVIATDAATIAVTTDGNPPASSPSLASGVHAASEVFALIWTGVGNADPVKYEVHVSTTSSFTPTLGDPATLVATTPASIVFLRKDASGASFQSGIKYYFRLIAFDEDGDAAAGTVGSGILEATGGGANLLRDGDFEAEDTITTVLSNARLSCAGSIDIEETIVFHGSRSCKIVSSGAGGGLLGMDVSWFDGTFGTEGPVVTPGLPYTFSAWHYNATGSTRHARAVIQWLDSGIGALGGTVTSDLVECPPNTWTRTQVTGIAPASAVYGWPECGFTDLANTEIGYVDAMQFEQGEVATAFSTFSNQGIFREVVVAGEIIAEHFEAVMALVSSLMAGTAGAERVEVGLGTNTDGEFDGFVGIRSFESDGTTQTFTLDAATGNVFVKGRLDFGDGSHIDDDFITLYENPASGYANGVIVQSATNKTTGGGTNTAGAQFPAPTTPGNAIIFAVAMLDKDGTAPTPTTTAGWTLQSSNKFTGPYGADSGLLYVYTKDDVSTVITANIPIILLNDTGYHTEILLEVSGITPGTAGFDKVSTADSDSGGASNVISAGTTPGTLSQTEEYCIGFLATCTAGDDNKKLAGTPDNSFGNVTQVVATDAGQPYIHMRAYSKQVSATTAVSLTDDTVDGVTTALYVGSILTFKRAANSADPAPTGLTDQIKIYAKDRDGETRLYAVGPGGPSSAGLYHPLTPPAGVLHPYAGSTAPLGYLLCYGQAVGRTDYPALFAAIGTTYGVGDGSTTFNLPDMRGRIPLTLDNMGGSDATRLSMANTLGGVGGLEEITLTAAQSGLRAHTHTLDISQTNTATGGSATRVTNGGGAGTTGSASIGGDPATTAHTNLQPYILMNYIIKT